MGHAFQKMSFQHHWLHRIPPSYHLLLSLTNEVAFSNYCSQLGIIIRPGLLLWMHVKSVIMSTPVSQISSPRCGFPVLVILLELRIRIYVHLCSKEINSITEGQRESLKVLLHSIIMCSRSMWFASIFNRDQYFQLLF